MKPIISQSIKFIRFPLAFIIILKHFYTFDVVKVLPQRDDLVNYHILGGLTADYFPAFSVPLFFFISGYLFFVGIDFSNPDRSFTIGKYVKKISKRIKTLVVPYLLWNLIVLMTMLMVQVCSNDVIQPLSMSLADFRAEDFFKAFWSITEKGCPIDGPLWFVRDLFIICLFTPIIFLWVKYTKLWGLLLVLILYLYRGFIVPLPLPSSCQGFFVLGCYFALLPFDLLKKTSELNPFLMMSLVLICFIIFVNTECYTPAYWLCFRIYSLIAVLSVWSCVRYLIDKFDVRVHDTLSNSSFFIFASHKPIMYVCCLLIFKTLKPENELLLCSLVFVVPIIVCMICLSMYYGMRKYAPWLKCLNGFRL